MRWGFLIIITSLSQNLMNLKTVIQLVYTSVPCVHEVCYLGITSVGKINYNYKCLLVYIMYVQDVEQMTRSVS